MADGDLEVDVWLEEDVLLDSLPLSLNALR